MSIFPVTPLSKRVQSLILATFEVSQQAAQDYAAEFVALAEGWGSPEKAVQLDWSYRIKKDLGEKLPWKSDADRQAFNRDQEERHKAYDILIRRPLNKPAAGKAGIARRLPVGHHCPGLPEPER